ncbi:MAG: hypothetical protein Q9191_004071 [Dirinaria sp. TL-2023a]
MAGNDAFLDALERNKKWAARTAKDQPDLFPTCAKGQSPKILWLGCSDSRVPESTLLDLCPGSVFVHRNIANVLTSTDLSSTAVITYGVEHLKVDHVVVCGHTSCGGVAAAMGNARLGVLDLWLTPLRELRARFKPLWAKEGLSEEDMKARLVVENVKQGVKTVRENPEVTAAVKERGLRVHGVVYNIGSGELKLVETKEPHPEQSAREEAFLIT